MSAESQEDYLKAIYRLTRDGAPANTSQLAAFLQIRPASVTGMLQRLAESQPPLVIYRKRHGVRLTEAGQRIALRTIRRHRLLETYLVQKLGYRWDEVHEEACRLEHVISEKLEARIAAALGHPQRDPHGDPIPQDDLSLPQMALQPLSLAPVGATVRIMRIVQDNDAELLRYLHKENLVPGAVLRVLARNLLDETTQITRDTGPALFLGWPITHHILVEVIT